MVSLSVPVELVQQVLLLTFLANQLFFALQVVLKKTSYKNILS